MLWLGLLTRDTGIPASKRLKIRDEVVALDFDRAVTLRLFRFDNDKDASFHKLLIKLAGAEMADDDDTILDSSELHNLVRNDPYADKNTIIS